MLLMQICKYVNIMRVIPYIMGNKYVKGRLLYSIFLIKKIYIQYLSTTYDTFVYSLFLKIVT